MKYTLNQFMADLRNINQDLPIILSQDESPQLFQSLYIDQVHLIIKEGIDTKVGDLLALAEYFVQVQKENDKVCDERIFVTKIIDGEIFSMVVNGVSELYGNVYLVLDEED